MEFNLQDPTYENTKPLGESLLNGLSHMSQGGGVYAFATSEGVKAILGDRRFRDFISKGYYYLVVGTDDITDIAALNTLKLFEEEYKGHLTVKVYIHSGVGSILHPKYSWFKGYCSTGLTEEIAGGKIHSENMAHLSGTSKNTETIKGVLIIGSGNLTKRGMKNNREAYVVIPCGGRDILEVEDEWQRWINHSRVCLYDLNHAVEILAKRDKTILGRIMPAIKKVLMRFGGKAKNER
ncbi:MAG: phospholipase D family protein [Clostridiales bacterium]|nr:phospholipase D family protein [Clostridiales bacterium]